MSEQAQIIEHGQTESNREIQTHQSREVASRNVSELSVLDAICRAASDPTVDIDKFERLMGMQQRLEANQARKAFFDALSGFQSDCPLIKKLKTAKFATRNGGEMSYNYASLDDIAEQIKPLLVRHGLSYRFEQSLENGNQIQITCILTHRDGHSETTTMAAPPDTSGNKNVLQQSASTVTYLRRYTLTGALGISTADQDIDGRLPEPTQESRATAALPEYPDEKFRANWDTWVEKVKSGKSSPAHLISMLSAKYTLSDEQKAKINDMENSA